MTNSVKLISLLWQYGSGVVVVVVVFIVVDVIGELVTVETVMVVVVNGSSLAQYL